MYILGFYAFQSVFLLLYKMGMLYMYLVAILSLVLSLRETKL